MIGLNEAVKIVYKNAEDGKKIFGMAETDDLYIFSYDTEEGRHAFGGTDPEKYVRTVNKKTGKYSWLDFNGYCNLVDSTNVYNKRACYM